MSLVLHLLWALLLVVLIMQWLMPSVMVSMILTWIRILRRFW